VLIILGLLIGGILGGQSLIKASELRALVTEQEKYQIAFNNFREKYNALPGDFTKATAFWGTAANCPGTAAQGTTDGTTCDGDGNGEIDYYYANSNEAFRAWQHLSNAGLIEGTYNGVRGQPIPDMH
jgi:hypothetical protein